MSEDLDLTADFVIESKENLSIAEEDYLTMEQQGENVDIELINRTFRCVHSIKGGAGFLGLNNISDLAHAMENMMDLIRKGDRDPDKAIINLLLEGVDTLNAMFDDIANSNEFDISTLRDQLLALANGPNQAAAPKNLTIDPNKVMEEEAESITHNEFMAEFKMNLRIIEECLSAFQRDPKEGLAWVQSARDSFEVIKESAAEIQYENTFILSNIIETMLDEIEKGTVQPDEESLSLFQEGVATLNVMFDEDDSGELEDVEDIYNSICALMQNSAEGISIPEKEVEGPFKTVAPSSAPQPEVPKKREKAASTKATQQDSTELTSSRIINPKPEGPTKSTGGAGAAGATNTGGAAGEASSSNETIRVKVSLLNHLMSLAGEMVLIRNQQLQLTETIDPAKLRSNTQRLDVITTELQECVMQTRMQPVGTLFNKFNRVVRDLGNKLGKEIKLEIAGSEVELDRSMLELLSDPLTHMIRNSCDHGLELPQTRLEQGKTEYGNLRLSAWHEGGQINIEVRDDGKGIHPEAIKQSVLKKGLKSKEELDEMNEKEILNLIMLPGFSTAEKVSDVSGRGVGMDVVRSNIEKIGGKLDLDSVPGKGTAVRFRLPLTLAIISCLIVKVGEERFAIPRVNVEELVTLYNHDVREKIETAHGREVFRLRDRLLPMLRLREILESKDPLTSIDHTLISKKHYEEQLRLLDEFEAMRSQSKWGDEKFRQNLTFAVLKVGAIRYGLIVDELLGTEEIVVKSMHPYMQHLSCYAGVTVMGDGRVAHILDVMGVARHGNIRYEIDEELDLEKVTSIADIKQSILIFKSGVKEQFAISLGLVKRIERINKNDIEEVGDKKFIAIDDISIQIVSLDQIINVSPFAQKEEEENEVFLLIPQIERPFGILVSSIEDSLDYSIQLNRASYREEGIMGTAQIEGRMTLFLDVYQLLERIDPDWAKEKQLLTKPEDQEKRILLVEDTSFYRTMVKGYLESAGYQVISSENGKEALKKFQEYDFDLIVSDLEMPEMNGFEFIRNVRTILNNQTIGALALTSLDTPEDKQRAQECGFNGYEVKMDRSQLLQKIANLLN